jgi:hypothetical protein
MFHIYVANVLSGCCVCFTMILSVSHVFLQVFQMSFQEFCPPVHMQMKFVIFIWIFVKWVWISNFVTMHIYKCTIGVCSFNFFKTPKYSFNEVFMNCTEDVVCTEYFAELPRWVSFRTQALSPWQRPIQATGGGGKRARRTSLRQHRQEPTRPITQWPKWPSGSFTIWDGPASLII